MNKLSWKYFRSQIAWLLACIMIFNPFAELSLGLIQISAAPIAQDLMLSQNEIEEILEDTDYQGIELESEELPFKKSIRQELEMFLEDQLDEGYILLKQSLNDNILTLIMANVPEETTNGCPTSNIKVVVINGDNSELNLNVKVAGNQLNVDEGSVSYYTVNTSTKTKVHSDSDSDVYTPSEATVYSPSEPEQEVIDSDGHFDLSEEAISLLDADSEDANAPTMMFKSTKRAGGLGLNVSQDSIMVLDLSTVAYANVFDFAQSVVDYANANPTAGTVFNMFMDSMPNGDVLTGKTVTYSYSYVINSPEVYPGGANEHPYAIYEQLNNMKLYIALPNGLIPETSSAQNWVKVNNPIMVGYTVYCYELGTGINGSNTVKIQVKMGDNGKLPIGTTFTLPTEYMWMTCDLPVVNQTTKETRTYHVTQRPKDAVSSTIKSTSDDKWAITKEIQLVNNKAWNVVEKGGQKYVEVRYLIEAGFPQDVNGETVINNDPNSYMTYGRTGFKTYEISDSLAISGVAPVPTVNPVSVDVYLGDVSGGNKIASTTNGATVTFNNYETVGNRTSAISVDSSAPFYSRYTVVATYPYDTFVLSYNDNRKNDGKTFKVSNTATLGYCLNGGTDDTSTDNADTVIQIVENEASIVIKKQIKDLITNTNKDYNADLAAQYPGAAQFEIKRVKNGKAESYSNYTIKVSGVSNGEKTIVVNPVKESEESYSYITGADGSVKIVLDPGTYIINEIKAPNGTAIPVAFAGDQYQVVVGENETKTVTVVNTPTTGALKFVKRGIDSDGNRVVLQGVKYELWSTGDDSKRMAEATSDKNGVVTFNYLPAGTYTLKEVSTANGYKLPSTNGYSVTIESGELTDLSNESATGTDESVFLNKKNEGKVIVTKKVQDDKGYFVNVPSNLQSIFNGQFWIEQKINGNWVRVNESKTYSLNNNAQFSEKLSAGEYRVAELLPKDKGFTNYTGSYLSTDQTIAYKNFTVTAAGTTNVELMNIRAGHLAINKKTVNVGSNGTLNVVNDTKDRTFDLYKKNSSNSYEKVNNASLVVKAGKTLDVYSLPVFDNGKKVEYYLVENLSDNEAKEWMLDTTSSNKIASITVNEKSVRAIGPLTVSRTDKTSVTAYNVQQKIPHWVVKVNSLTNARISGAEISASYGEGSSKTTAYSNVSIPTNNYGAMLLLDLDKAYTITETKVPAGYEAIESSSTQTVTAYKTKDPYKDGITKAELEALLNEREKDRENNVNPINTTVIKNSPYPKVKINKNVEEYGEETTTPNTIVFDVYDAKTYDNEHKLQKVGTLNSNQTGSLPSGEYYFAENLDSLAANGIINPAFMYKVEDDKVVKNSELGWEWVPNLNNASMYRIITNESGQKILLYGPCTITVPNSVSQIQQTFFATNYKNRAALNVKKIDIVTNNPLADAEFTASGNSTTYSLSKTDNKGFTSTYILPFVDNNGNIINYTVKETVAPVNYFAAADQTTKLNPKEVTTLTFKDEPQIAIRTPKVWKDLWQDKFGSVEYELEGVTVALYEDLGNNKVKYIGEAVTDADGVAVFKGLKRNTKYYVSEVDVPTPEEIGGLYVEMPFYTDNGAEKQKIALPTGYNANGSDGVCSAITVNDLKTKYNAVPYQWVETTGREGDTYQIQTTDRIVNIKPWVQITVPKYCDGTLGHVKNTPLNGAKFELYRQVVKPEAMADSNGGIVLSTTYADIQASPDQFELINEYESGTKVDNNGKRVDGWFDTDILESGYIYWLVETESAHGHQMLSNDGNPYVVAVYYPGTTYRYSYSSQTTNGGQAPILQSYHAKLNVSNPIYNKPTTGNGSDYEAQIKLNKWLETTNNGSIAYTPLGGVTYEIWLTEMNPTNGTYKEIALIDTVTTGLEVGENNNPIYASALSKFIDFGELETILKANGYTDATLNRVIVSGKDVPSDETEKVDYKEARFVLKEVDAPAKIVMDTEAKPLILRAYAGMAEQYNDYYFYPDNTSGVKTEDENHERLVNWRQDKYQVVIQKWGYTPVGSNLDYGQTDSENYLKTTFGKTDEELDLLYEQNKTVAEQMYRVPLEIKFQLEKQEYDYATGSYVWVKVNNPNAEENEPKDVFVTSGFGRSELQLKPGYYRLKETDYVTESASEQYLLSYDGQKAENQNFYTYRYFKVGSQSTFVSVYNPKKPSILIEKTAWDGTLGNKLEGIEFELTKGSSRLKATTALVVENAGESSESTHSIARFDNLASGTYELNSESFNTDDAKNLVTLNYFALNGSVNSNARSISVGYTKAFNSDGQLYLKRVEDTGVVSNEGNEYKIVVKNPQLEDLKIQKKDSVKNNVPLSDVKFDVYYQPFTNDDMSSGYLKNDAGLATRKGQLDSTKWQKLSTQMVTGTNGTATLNDQIPGWYKLVEVTAPTGYELDQTPIIVCLKADMVNPIHINNQTATATVSPVVITNVPKVKLELTKTLEFGAFDGDAETVAKDLELAFEIYKVSIENNAITSVGNKEATIKLDDFKKSSGTYSDSDEGIWLSIPGSGSAYALKEVPSNQWLLPENDGQNGAAWVRKTFNNVDYLVLTDPFNGTKTSVSVTVKNIYSKAVVEIKKVKEKYPTALLSGAVFRLYEDADCKKEVANFTEIGISGTYKAEFYADQLTAETYYIKEIVAPVGHVKLTDAIEVSVTPGTTSSYSDQTNFKELTITNESGIDVQIFKYSEAESVVNGSVTQESYLYSGAKFDLYQYDAVNENWRYLKTETTVNGVLTFTGLEVDGTPRQSYAIAEHAIKDSNELLEFRLEAIYADGSNGALTKVATIDGKDLYKLNMEEASIGGVEKYRAYNIPSEQVKLVKGNLDANANMPADTKATVTIYEDNNGTKGAQIGNPIVVPYGTAGVTVPLQTGKYIVEETGITSTNGNFIITHDDTAVKYMQQIEVQDGKLIIDGKETSEVNFNNVTQSYSLTLTKTVLDSNKQPVTKDGHDFANGVTIEEPRWANDQTLTYRLTPTVTNTLPLDSFVVEDDGLVFINSNNQEMAYLDYVKDQYAITGVTLSKVSFDNRVRSISNPNEAVKADNGSEITIKAKVEFYGFGESTMERPENPLATTVVNVSGSVADQISVPVPTEMADKAASVVISYYSEELRTNAENGKTAYALPQSFNPGYIDIDTVIYRQPNKLSNGEFTVGVSKIENRADASLTVRPWDQSGKQLAAIPVPDADKVATDVAGPKAPIIKLENSSSAANDVHIDEIITYTLKITNTEPAGTDNPMESPVLMDQLPNGMTMVVGSQALTTDSPGLTLPTANTTLMTAENGQQVVVFQMTGDLEAGKEAAITFNVTVNGSSVMKETDNMTNYCYVTSAVSRPPILENPTGVSFKIFVNEQAQKADWPSMVLGEQMTGLSPEVLKTLQTQISGSWKASQFISASVYNILKYSGSVQLLKEVKGNLDNRFMDKEVGKVQKGVNTDLTETPDDGVARFRLNVKNTSDSQTITDVRIADVLPNIGDGRNSKWRLQFVGIESVEVAGVSLNSNQYKVYYTDAPCTSTLKKDMSDALLKIANKQNQSLLKEWTSNDNANATGIAIEIEGISLKNNEKVVIVYKTVVPYNDLKDLQTYYDDYGNNDFQLVYNYKTTDNNTPKVFPAPVPSNEVRVLLTPKVVEVGGRIWLDDNGNGIQDADEIENDEKAENGNTSFRNSMIRDIWSYYVTDVQLRMWESGKDKYFVNVDQHTYEKGRFVFSSLIPSRTTDETSIYTADHKLIPSNLVGKAQVNYQLYLNIAGQNGKFANAKIQNKYPGLYLSLTKHAAGNKEPNRSRKPSELYGTTQTTAKYTRETLDNNFFVSGDDTVSENFFLWAEYGPYDHTKDAGFVPLRDVTITKQNDDGNPLAGAKFNIYGPFDSEPTTADMTAANRIKNGITTDENGKLEVKGLLYLKHYIIEEVEASTGYTPYHAEVNKSLKELTDSYLSSSWILPSMESVTSGTDLSAITVTNKAKKQLTGSIEIEKRDYVSNALIGGAVFSLKGDASNPEWVAYVDAVEDAAMEQTLSGNYWMDWGTNTNAIQVRVVNDAVNGDYLLLKVTNEKGTLSNVPYGTYQLDEVAAPEGYVLELNPNPNPEGESWSDSFTIDSTEGAVTEQKFIWVAEGNDTSIKNRKPNLTISKIGKDLDNATDKALAGAEFILKAEDGRYLRLTEMTESGSYQFASYVNTEAEATTMVTNASGKIHVMNLDAVKYTLIETKAPAGYLVSADTSVNMNPETALGSEFAVTTDQDVTVTDPKAEIQLTLKKTIAGSSTPVEGAVFGVYTDAGCDNKDLVAKITTGAYGTGTSVKEAGKILPYGTGIVYYVKEITAPTGYFLNPTVYKVKAFTWNDGVYTVTETIDGTHVDNVTNWEKPDLLLKKVAEEDETKALDGAAFILKMKDQTEGYAVLDEVKDASGNLLGYRPTGYSSNKADATTVRTNAAGEIQFYDLEAEMYQLIEITPPLGYALDPNPEKNITEIDMSKGINAQIMELILGSKKSENINHTITIENKLSSVRLNVVKVDGKTDRVLPGAEFILKHETKGYAVLNEERNASDQLIGYRSMGIFTDSNATKFVTDENGKVQILGLEGAKYQLIETKAPDGYQLRENAYEFDLTGIESKDIDEQIETITVDNEPKNIVLTLKKTDSSLEKGLAGAEFGVYTNSNCETPVGTIVTDEDGIGTSTEVPFGATYYVKETKAPTGYFLNEMVYKVEAFTWADKYEVVTTVDGETVEAIINWEKPDLTIQKVDSKDGSVVLEGAEFILKHKNDGYVKLEQVLDGSNELIGYRPTGQYTADQAEATVVVTNKNGEIKFFDLEIAKYVLIETSAPAGYELDKNPETTIDMSGGLIHNLVNLIMGTKSYDDQVKVIKNELRKVRLEIEKVDSVDENKKLAYAEFIMKHETNGYVVLNEIRDAEMKLVGYRFMDEYSQNMNDATRFRTGEDGTVQIFGLEDTVYQLIETEAPLGYHITQTETTVDMRGVADSLSQKTKVIVANEQNTVKLRLTKVSSDTLAGLSGAEFGVYTDEACKNQVSTIITGEGGVGYSDELKYGITYYVKELKAPSGYYKRRDVFKVETSELSDVFDVTSMVNGNMVMYVLNNPVDDDDDPPTPPKPPVTPPETPPTPPTPPETPPTPPTPPTAPPEDPTIPPEIRERYPGLTRDELIRMGVLGAYDEFGQPLGLLPATGDPAFRK